MDKQAINKELTSINIETAAQIISTLQLDEVVDPFHLVELSNEFRVGFSLNLVISMCMIHVCVPVIGYSSERLSLTSRVYFGIICVWCYQKFGPCCGGSNQFLNLPDCFTTAPSLFEKP